MPEPSLAYLDHAATSPLRPEAADAMVPWMRGGFGNPSGSHRVARAARAAVDDARDVVAGALGVAPAGVVFTGGGTEADNLALAAGAGRVVVVGAAEHHAVLHPAEAWAAEVRTVPLDRRGLPDLDALAAALDAEVAVVSMMLVNNEIGTVTPLDDVAALVRRHAPRALLHTDAVQGAPWLDLRVAAAGADVVSISAHKFGGPQGVGALVVRDGVEVPALLHGGGQERERRPGTHNVAGIVGAAAALAAAAAGRDAEAARVARLRDRLAGGLLAAVDGAAETGERAVKVPGNCHVHFPGVESEALLVLLDEGGVCASAGSACASGAIEPSHVLLAMGLRPDEADGALRLTLGWTSTDADVDRALEVVPDAVGRLRRGAKP